MVSLTNVSKSYGDIVAVQGVTFRILRGEYVFLIGPSGAGKTTVLRLIHHDERPTSGTIEVGEFRSDRVRGKQAPRLRRLVGFVYQDFRLIGDRSVHENVALVLRIVGAPRRTIDKRVKEVMAEVGLLGRMRDRASDLSGGEMQRVAIARALVNQPLLLLADEPTGNLDPETAREIYDLLARVNVRGTAVLLATHDQARAHASGHRVLRLERGRLAPDSAPAEPPRAVVRA
ncbi:MAG: ATP-binding cassette domain-containing protein [Candidatus Latescibacterota bacterium]|nr:MAG: ATP-binding cassette domain-containing protein [Candidatus Latescibacterota bacterium]